mmetsp:Transcript_4054/g.12698  ORF Transcript_4054/g.12698 Transcript_4054/m.12698 type:complete len:299 (+) Transcript_4054:196-1092(+)
MHWGPSIAPSSARGGGGLFSCVSRVHVLPECGDIPVNLGSRIFLTTPSMRNEDDNGYMELGNVLNDDGLVFNVHQGVPLPLGTVAVKGEYLYYHFGAQGFDDRGWGCAYRSLQTLCSFLRLAGHAERAEPTHREVQETLVELKDKPEGFVGSKEWIGSFELCLFLDVKYDVPCKILSVNCASELVDHASTFMEHFTRFGSPIMLGGGSAAVTIVGINVLSNPVKVLVVDPHYTGMGGAEAKAQGYVAWKPLESVGEKGAHYNALLMQVLAQVKRRTGTETIETSMSYESGAAQASETG